MLAPDYSVANHQGNPKTRASKRNVELYSQAFRSAMAAPDSSASRVEHFLRLFIFH
jgi:hypothetical protein